MTSTEVDTQFSSVSHGIRMVMCCHVQAEYLAGFARLISVRYVFPTIGRAK